jgi:ADP-L-glycero-D-manno-heptose 6-epimerase
MMKKNTINFNNKTILITGGAGFIGSNLAFYFQNNYPSSRIIIFDCFRSESEISDNRPISFGHYKNLIGFNGHIICGNINNMNDLKLLSKFKFDFIFHQAAISDTRFYNQEVVIKTNVNSFYDLLEIAKKNKATMVYASSAATYGSLPSPQTLGEENPENPYGYSKYVMDQIATRYSIENPDMVVTGLRYFNVYGPREYYKASTASMIIQLAHQILKKKSPRLFFDSDKIMRDFIYVDDVIQANINAALSNRNGIYNVGTGIPRSFEDIVTILQVELNSNFDIEYFSNPFKGYQMHTQADIKNSIVDLNFDPKFSLEKGIKAYIPEILRLYGADI